MRCFTIVAPNCTREDLNLWEDTSFKLMDAEEFRDNPEQRPDIFLWHCSQEDMPGQMILSLLPKLFVVMGAPGDEVPIPGELAEIFSIQHIAADSIHFAIGSRIQDLAAVPDWEAYRRHSTITHEEQIKAAAGSIYRYLLEDVIRETAEWCGHMSSVVGQM